MSKKKQSQNSNDKFKRIKEVFVPDGDGGAWHLTHDACRGCGERIIEISGQTRDQDALFIVLGRVVGEQMMPDFVGNEEVQFHLEVSAMPST